MLTPDAPDVPALDECAVYPRYQLVPAEAAV